MTMPSASKAATQTASVVTAVFISVRPKPGRRAEVARRPWRTSPRRCRCGGSGPGARRGCGGLSGDFQFLAYSEPVSGELVRLPDRIDRGTEPVGNLGEVVAALDRVLLFSGG